MTDIPPTPGPNAPAEPLVAPGTIVAVAAAIIGGVVAFGINLSPAQTGAILTIVGVLAPIAVAIWGRAKVYSPATVRTMVKAAQNKTVI